MTAPLPSPPLVAHPALAALPARPAAGARPPPLSPAALRSGGARGHQLCPPHGGGQPRAASLPGRPGSPCPGAACPRRCARLGTDAHHRPGRTRSGAYLPQRRQARRDPAGVAVECAGGRAPGAAAVPGQSRRSRRSLNCWGMRPGARTSPPRICWRAASSGAGNTTMPPAVAASVPTRRSRRAGSRRFARWWSGPGRQTPPTR